MKTQSIEEAWEPKWDGLTYHTVFYEKFPDRIKYRWATDESGNKQGWYQIFNVHQAPTLSILFKHNNPVKYKSCAWLAQDKWYDDLRDAEPSKEGYVDFGSSIPGYGQDYNIPIFDSVLPATGCSLVRIENQIRIMEENVND